MARLQFVYDQVLRDVQRTGKDQPLREVQIIAAARRREAFGEGPLPGPARDLLADAGQLARRQRVVV
jgi:hypothetical protein